MRKLSEAQILLCQHLREIFKEQGDWQIETEYKFAEGRRWKFDVAIPSHRLAFECDGGHRWHRGWHIGKKRRELAKRMGRKPTSPIEDDYERQNSAIMDGWRLFRFTNEQILDGRARAWLKEVLGET